MYAYNLNGHKNQIVILNGNLAQFQSYDILIAWQNKDMPLHLSEKYWDYSITTLKHLYEYIHKYCKLLEWYPLFKNAKNKKKCIQSLIEKGYIETWK